MQMGFEREAVPRTLKILKVLASVYISSTLRNDWRISSRGEE